MGLKWILYSGMILLLVAGLYSAQIMAISDRSAGDMDRTVDKRILAPEFPDYAEWINTERAYRMSDFKGKVVLLDFWTYCCINCMHVLPELKRLEQKYPELVVLGVHSAKFTGEKELENIREAVVRYDIEHPVINDHRFELWNAYGIRAWPSFVLIDPLGGIAGKASGEGLYSFFDQNIGKIVREFDARGLINKERIEFKLDKFNTPRSVLSYPGKLEVDPVKGRIFVSDSNNDRVLVIDPAGRVLDVIGSGKAGNRDGTFEQASFFRPQGMAYDSAAGILYIADTENHTIRKVELASRRVSTILGTGQQARGYSSGGVGRNVAINSPWDLVLLDGLLIIAMAGPHQLWSLAPASGEAKVFAGNGRENIVDGPAENAQLAQPSGLSTDGSAVYFADSEVSAVRKVADGRVSTLVGQGLFEYGDIDGDLNQARLQHALGVLYHQGMIFVADTYNNKIKLIDPKKGEIRTLIGSGMSGKKDGPANQARLNEPNDIKYLGGRFYITDTNNGLIRVFDPESQEVGTLSLKGLEKLNPDKGSSYVKTLHFPRQVVKPEVNTLEISVALKPALELNNEAPHYLDVSSSNSEVFRVLPFELANRSGEFEVSIPVELSEGEASVRLELGLYYCEKEEKSSCFIEQAVLEVPVSVSPEGHRELRVVHEI